MTDGETMAWYAAFMRAAKLVPLRRRTAWMLPVLRVTAEEAASDAFAELLGRGVMDRSGPCVKFAFECVRFRMLRKVSKTPMNIDSHVRTDEGPVDVFDFVTPERIFLDGKARTYGQHFSRVYYLKNRERIIARKEAWRAANRQRYNKAQREYRARVGIVKRPGIFGRPPIVTPETLADPLWVETLDAFARGEVATRAAARTLGISKSAFARHFPKRGVKVEREKHDDKCYWERMVSDDQR